MRLFWVVMTFVVFINVLASTILPKFEGFILVIHIVGFFAILLPLAILGEHQDFYQVFGLWLNEGFLPSQGVSFMVGLLGPVFKFLDADGTVHVGLGNRLLQHLLISLCRCPKKFTMRQQCCRGLSCSASLPMVP